MGAAYVMRRALFVETGERFCGRAMLHVMDEAHSLEIDSLLDLVKAEAALRHLQEGERMTQLPSHVSALVLDFDGVLTDDAVVVDQHGIEAVRCSRGDGLGLSLLRARGMRLLILSKEQNPVVTARAKKLQIECLQGEDDKLSTLERWASEKKIDLDRALYVGNDINDLACMRRVGCAVAPRDAHPAALRAARIVLDRPGGQGAVRELCDLLLARG